MRKQFVTYKMASDLKALGFEEPCMGIIYPDGEVMVGSPEWVKIMLRDDLEKAVPAVLWQQACDWLMENHEICVAESVRTHYPTFELFERGRRLTGFESDTRKGALSAAINKAIIYVKEME